MESNPPRLRPPTTSPVVRILGFWIQHRRTILAAMLAAALAIFFTALQPSTRDSIIRGMLARRPLVALLLFFSLLTLSLFWTVGQNVDAWVFIRFNLHGYRPAWMDRVMWALTQLGTFILALVLAALFFAINLRSLAIEIMLGTISLWLIVELVKALTDRSRPYIVLTGARVVGWRERGKSFPSGHTSQTFFLISLLVHYFAPVWWLGLVMYAVAVLVGVTRMYVGAHYPRDVLAGASLGLMWSLWYYIMDPYIVNWQLWRLH